MTQHKNWSNKYIYYHYCSGYYYVYDVGWTSLFDQILLWVKIQWYLFLVLKSVIFNFYGGMG